jgi:hypothetical protein
MFYVFWSKHTETEKQKGVLFRTGRCAEAIVSRSDRKGTQANLFLAEFSEKNMKSSVLRMCQFMNFCQANHDRFMR